MGQMPSGVGGRRGRRAPHTRLVGGQVPEDMADLFLDICEARGMSGASVVRRFVLEFVAENEHEIAKAHGQRELPMTG